MSVMHIPENNNYQVGDVRNDPLGLINNFINWVYLGKKPRILKRLVAILFHVELPSLAFSVRLPHPYGIVVNSGVRLGKNVTIYQHVTIGSKRHGVKAGVPSVADNVVIYPNAVIVGSVHIGKGAIIAPGCVVIDDVPPGATVVGGASRIING